jgi:hypothetical protein
LKKWADFKGYGFNLHAERAKVGQHIGKVDENSPAEAAGLKEHDRIIEVNNVNISNENHQQVVKRIRTGLELDEGVMRDDEVMLLVVDQECDDYYKSLGVIVRNDFDNIIRLTTPDRADYTPLPPSALLKPPPPVLSTFVSHESGVDSNNNKTSTSSISSASEIIHSKQNSKNDNEIIVVVSSNQEVPSAEDRRLSHYSNNSSTSSSQIAPTTKLNAEQPQSSRQRNDSNASIDNNRLATASTSNTTTELKTSGSASSSSSNVIKTETNSNKLQTNSTSNMNGKTNAPQDTVNPFQMSAAEFKNYLKAKGRNDPRISSVDMKKKYEIFQDM